MVESKIKDKEMNLKLKHLGAFGGYAAKIIELTVEGNESTITEEVTDLTGKVAETLIIELRAVADELEDQNKLLLKIKK